jgi:hypothetical protein
MGGQSPLGKQLGTFEASELFRQWDQLRQLEARREEVVESTDLGFTARKFDEAKTAGHRPYILAGSHLSNGFEHIEVLRELFLKSGVTPRAPWTLLRSVFESGCWATWVLEPEDSLERRRRGLRGEVRSQIERDNFFNDFLRYQPQERDRIAADHREDEQVFRFEADELGLTWSQAKNKTNLVDELGKLKSVLNMDPDVRAATTAMWRSMSGMQHGHAYAVVLNSDVHNSVPVQGGALQTVTIKDNMFIAAAGSANTLMASAIELFIRRCTRT